MYEVGPLTVIGEHEDEPDGWFVRIVPFSGGHPSHYPWWNTSTRHVIEAMPDVAGLTVMDFGCGGACILGIAAAKRGAARVIAIERQPALADIARQQVMANGLGDVVVVITATEPTEMVDLMLANLGDAHHVGKVSHWATHGIGIADDETVITW